MTASFINPVNTSLSSEGVVRDYLDPDSDPNACKKELATSWVDCWRWFVLPIPLPARTA